MDETELQNEFNNWFSTYGLITSQRILGHFQINIPPKDLIPAIKNSTSLYHLLVQVPLKNVLNGIILQQANDYHIYVQKLFIDYLLSGESGKPPEAQGASTRESIEEERKNLVALGEEFNQKQMDHDQFVASSQNKLINLTKELKSCIAKAITLFTKLAKKEQAKVNNKTIERAIIHALIHCYEAKDNSQTQGQFSFFDKVNSMIKIRCSAESLNLVQEELAGFLELIASVREVINELQEEVDTITQAARSFRTQFYNIALRVIELIGFLPEYRIDPEQDKINRESLFFDKTLGE